MDNILYQMADHGRHYRNFQNPVQVLYIPDVLSPNLFTASDFSNVILP
tara:strand:+ start:10071 stop:10214 length:144 start_codon:yes stop_codon:yes gene_type:complete